VNTHRLETDTGAGGVTDWRWPLWGTAAGILGAGGHLVTLQAPTQAQLDTGAGVIATLDRGNYHLGIVTGLAGVFCLLVFAAGWRRWAAATAPGSLAGGMVPLALTASAGALILGYGFKGALAVYLQGGSDAGSYPAEYLMTFFMFDDFGAFIGWWGVAMAAAAIAWTALRERRLPVWIGLVSALVVLLPAGIVAATGLPGFPGVVDPFYLVILGPALAFTFRRAASGAARASTSQVSAGMSPLQQV